MTIYVLHHTWYDQENCFRSEVVGVFDSFEALNEARKEFPDKPYDGCGWQCMDLNSVYGLDYDH